MKKFKFNKIYKLPKTSGVYAIVNSLNGHKYTGRELRPNLKKTAMITACCKGFCKSAYGYLWKYDNGDYSDIPVYENNSMNGLIKRWNRNKV